MRKIIQNLADGSTILLDVPCPSCTKGSLLISTRTSIISPGTEKMLVDFGRANYLTKARQQPDKVKAVLEKVRVNGIFSTFEAVKSKLNQPLPLGYCNSGVVLESGVESYAVGDRVVSNGQHAEVVLVPKNLCARIPDQVDDDSAAFTVLAAIGLQGIRLASPTLGETVAVFGLGLIGLMTVQMLRANGCRVLGIDYNSNRCDMAREFGSDVVNLSKGEDLIAKSHAFSKGSGIDAVIVSAATKSDEVMHQAAQICRKRGRVVLVGSVGLNLRRDDFFKKEISFQVSASYGPGRYDDSYEEKGNDYPIGFVRWTEQRNFEAVLHMMAEGTLNVKPLITNRYNFDDAVDAYSKLNSGSTLGILLEYPVHDESLIRSASVCLNVSNSQKYDSSSPIVGFVGAGNYASRTLIPAFKATGAKLDTIVTAHGVSAAHHGSKNNFEIAATDLQLLWMSKKINTVVIASRHNLHCEQVISALESGKNVFVEKPLALKLEELESIHFAYQKINASRTEPLRLMVGFNRRFAPHIVKMKALLRVKSEPKTIIITVNAGFIPIDHWTQDLEVGGGRIIGEGCHFIDLMRHLIGHPITSHQVTMIGNAPEILVRDDKVSISLSFSDGSFGTIHYFSNGGKAFPKERIEVFCGDAVLQMDNYRILKGYGWPNFKRMKLMKQDKGQNKCANAFVESIREGKKSIIPYDQIMESSRVSIEVASSLRKNN